MSTARRRGEPDPWLAWPRAAKWPYCRLPDALAGLRPLRWTPTGPIHPTGSRTVIGIWPSTALLVVFEHGSGDSSDISIAILSTILPVRVDDGPVSPILCAPRARDNPDSVDNKFRRVGRGRPWVPCGDHRDPLSEERGWDQTLPHSSLRQRNVRGHPDPCRNCRMTKRAQRRVRQRYTTQQSSSSPSPGPQANIVARRRENKKQGTTTYPNWIDCTCLRITAALSLRVILSGQRKSMTRTLSLEDTQKQTQ